MKSHLILLIATLTAMILLPLCTPSTKPSPSWPRKYATTIVRGHINGKPADMESVLTTLSSYKTKHVKGDMFPAEVADSAGTFRQKWEMSWPMNMTLRLCGININLTLCPGDTIDIVMDYNKAMELKNDIHRLFTEAIQIDGGQLPRSAEYNVMAKKLLGEASRIDVTYIKEHAKEGFAAYRDWEWGKHMARLDTLKAANLQPCEAERLQMELEFAYLQALYNQKFLMEVSECDSVDVAKAEQEFTLKDPHCAQMLFPRSLVAACFFDTGCLEYLTANETDNLPLGQYLKERAEAEHMVARIKADRNVTKSDIEQLAAEFREPLTELMEQTQTTAKEKPEWQPEGEPAGWLSQIVERHTGHVVFIDFWATWCGPCQKGIAEMEKVKADYERRGVRFVYITDESSSSDGLRTMKEKHSGDHFLFTKLEIKQMNAPEFSGSIPHYLIYNRDGKLVKVLNGWGGLERVTKELDKALGK